MDNDDVVIEWTINTGFAGSVHEGKITIPRAEWDAMTPAERVRRLDGELEVDVENCIESSWCIVSGAPDDDVEVDWAAELVDPAADRAAAALRAVELHRPQWYDRHATATGDRYSAVSGRCEACGVNTTPAGCRTWQVANPTAS